MSKGSFRQVDVSRAIRAARSGGLDIASVVIDTNRDGARITITARDGADVPIDPERDKSNAHDKSDAPVLD